MSDNQKFNYSFSFKLPPEEAPKIGKFIILALIFIAANMVFAVAAIIRFAMVSNYGIYNTLFFVLVLLCCVGFIAAELFFTYRYLLIASIKAGYKKMTPFFQTLSGAMAEKFASDESFSEQNGKALDDGLLKDSYDKNAPWPVVKALKFFVRRIPFADFFENMSSGVNKKDAGSVSRTLYEQMDDYIVNNLFARNSLKTLFALYAANLTAQIVLLSFIK